MIIQGTLNRTPTGHGRRNNLMHKWKLPDTPSCDCRNKPRAIYYIVTERPVHAFKGTLNNMHEASEDVVRRIQSLDINS